MATHKSAIKRHRQSLARRAKNRSLKSRMKTSVKILLQSIDAKDTEQVQANFKQTATIIAKTAGKGVIHKNTASRKISRLAKKVNATLQAAGA